MQLPRSADGSESQCTVRSPQRKHSPGVRVVQTISERKPAARPAALPDAELRKLDALWRASNYLSVGQIYLLDNPLLRQRLTREHIKPRLLGHWGTTPGLNFIYAHLNRVIRARLNCSERDRVQPLDPAVARARDLRAGARPVSG